MPSPQEDLIRFVSEVRMYLRDFPELNRLIDGEETSDRMEIKISLKDSNLEIGFFDKGKPVIPENIQHRKLDDIKPGGLGTFFIKQIMDDAVFKKDEQQWVNHLVLSKKI